jgi:folate-dependent phosphoribosylglycinamide formyltransferase PurN
MPEGDKLTLRQASEEVGCSKALIQKMINEGEIVPQWYGFLQVVSRDDLEKIRARYERNKREG